MNTPPPCDNCIHLYYDAMTKDQPDGHIECMKDHVIGDRNCPEFKAAEPPMSSFVRIWSGEHEAWWRANGNGYTTQLQDAGVYERADAMRRITSDPAKRIKLEAIPLRATDCKYCRRAEKGIGWDFLCPPHLRSFTTGQNWADVAEHGPPPTHVANLAIPDNAFDIITIAVSGGTVTFDRTGKLTLSKPGIIDEAAEVFFRKVEEMLRLTGWPAVPAEIRAVGERVRTQDNLATAHPVFVVQQRERHGGVADGYADAYEWYNRDEGEVASEAQSVTLSKMQYRGWATGAWEHIGYRDHWTFVVACFTEQGCKDYIAANGHNLRDPRIYVESGYRNAEWIAMRAFLKGLKP